MWTGGADANTGAVARTCRGGESVPGDKIVVGKASSWIGRPRNLLSTLEIMDRPAGINATQARCRRSAFSCGTN